MVKQISNLPLEVIVSFQPLLRRPTEHDGKTDFHFTIGNSRVIPTITQRPTKREGKTDFYFTIDVASAQQLFRDPQRLDATTCIHVYMYTYTYICIYIYTYIYIYICMNIHNQAFVDASSMHQLDHFPLLAIRSLSRSL